jgi:hypothetical protein
MAAWVCGRRDNGLWKGWSAMQHGTIRELLTVLACVPWMHWEVSGDT